MRNSRKASKTAKLGAKTSLGSDRLARLGSGGDTLIPAASPITGSTFVDPDPAIQRLIKLPEVKDRTSLSKSAIYERIRALTFPAQIKLGARTAVWLERDIQRWILENASND